MTKALAVVIALSSTGCFTSWALTQAFGTQRILDEKVREQSVPLSGVEERLRVTVPLEIEYEIDRAVVDRSNPQAVSPQNKKELPFALTCSTDQYAQDRIYHSAFRYGSRWKKMSGGMFLAEAALASVFYLLDRNRDLSDPMKANDRSGLIAGGLLALDAVGTAAIFFIPRKEVYTVDDKPVVTAIRNDCPDGLVLEIAGDTFPINAAGGIGELGTVALDEWMRAPTGTIALTFEGRALPLQIGVREQCAWMKWHHADDIEATQRACSTPGQMVTTMDLPRVTTAVITVPTGTLTVADEPAAADSR